MSEMVSEMLKRQTANAVKAARREERERARDIVLAHDKGCTSIDPLCLRVIADQITKPAVGPTYDAPAKEVGDD